VPLLAGSGRLDGRVEGQQVRLVGNVVDDGHGLLNLFARRAQFLDRPGRVLDRIGNLVHFLHGLPDHLRAGLGLLPILLGRLGRPGGAVRVRGDGPAHLLHRGGHLVGLGVLPVGAVGQLVRHRPDLPCGRGRLLHGGVDLCERLAHLLDGPVEPVAEPVHEGLRFAEVLVEGVLHAARLKLNR